MNEDQAREYVASRCVSRGTMTALEFFSEHLLAANKVQNLIARSTEAHLWSRHIADSVQLLDIAPAEGSWIDLGSGPGFPGIIVAAVSGRSVTLVEERAKRVDFLLSACEILNIGARVTILKKRVEQVTMAAPAAIISARAFAPLDRLLSISGHLADARTTWILPKGKSAASELEAARQTWQGEFTTVPSKTDGAAAIIVAQQVRRRSSI